MRERRPGWTVCRAAIAVAALYALVLQAVLGSAAFAGPIDPTHIDPVHVLCAAEAGSGDDASKPMPAHNHLPCCTTAPVVGLTSPPVPPAIAIVWPIRRSVAIAWRPEVVAAPRAPPGISASARAPPAV